MRKISRFIAFLLATVFILSAPGPLGVVGVQGAENLNFSLSYTETLTEGTLSSAPTYVQKNLKEDEILSKWNFSRTGTYYLRYGIAKGKQVVFRVTKTAPETAEISYRVYNTTGGAITLPSYTISDYGKGYVPYDQFTTTNPSWNVVKPSPATPVDTARFNIANNTGFSIRYDSRRVQFLWNQNTFYFVTDGVEAGRIYDFDLYYTDDILGDVTLPIAFTPPAMPATLPAGINLVDDLSGSQKIMTGIKNLSSTPIANSTPIDGANPEGKVTLDYPADGWPGSDEVKLKIAFDAPLAWDAGSFDFTGAAAAANSFPSLTLRLDNSQSGDIINIIFDNITTAGAIAAAIAGGAIENGVNNTGGKIQFTLTGLKPGQIYDATSLYLTNVNNSIGTTSLGPTSFQLKPTYIEYGKVYTYLSYIIRPVDDQFYVFIDPYVGHPGYYLLRVNGRVVSQSERNNGTSTVILPATGKTGIPDNYQVFFSTSPFNDIGDVSQGNLKIDSQILKYTATLDDSTISFPDNFMVMDYEQRFTKASADESDLYLTLAWNIGKARTLQNLIPNQDDTLTIVYDINRTLSPIPDGDDGHNPFAKVELTIKNRNGTFWVTYSDTDGRVVHEEKPLDSYTDSVSKLLVYQAQVKLKVKAARAYDIDKGVYFVFPGIYFLNVKPTEINDVPETYLSASLYDNITLDEYNIPDVPAAQNIQSANVTTLNMNPDGKDQVSFDAKWNTPIDNLKDYLEYLFIEHTDQITNDTLKYNLYISQSETQMKAFAEQRSSKNTAYLPSAAGDSNILYFSKINGIDDSRVLMLDNKELRESLRNPSSVIGITGLPVNDPNNNIDDIIKLPITSGAALNISYTLDGLDKNQKYYVCVETVVEPPTGDTEGIRYSQLSAILAETTIGDPDILDPTDSEPPAPVFKDPPELDNVTAALSWDRVTENLSVPIDSLDYQIIRTKDIPLSDTILDNTGLKFEDIWQSGMLGFETDNRDLGLYPGSGSNFVAVADDELYWLDTSADPPTLRLLDKTLTTNSIYYYYIRAKRTANNLSGQPVVRYSKWTGLSLTTDPVQSPINLKVEQDRTDFDRYKEAIISFDAPITDDSTIGTEYNLLLQLKKDDGEWSGKDMSMLTSAASPIQGYRHYTYKITGLDPNTLYSVRVRIHDLINNDYSAYSNVAQIKTEFDQGDYDKDQATGDWLNYLTDILNKLLKDPYWVSKDNSGLFEAVYRPTMFDALLSQGTGGLLQLAETKADKAVYYLPASAVITANNRNVGFKITYDDMDVIFSPKAVDTDYNNAIIQIAERIKDKTITDYYVRVTVTRAEIGSTVEGDKPLTKQANVQVETVGSREDITKWDRNLLTKFAAIIADTDTLSAYKEEILQAIEDKTTNEELVKLVADIADDLKRDFIKDISSELDKAIRHSYALEYLDAPLILVAKGLDSSASVKAYQLISGTYTSYEVTNFGDNKAIYASTPGIYIFTGHVIVVPGLDNLQWAGSLAGIIGKYGLDDFFGKEGAFNLEAYATRYQIVGSIARMAGAPNSAEPFAWLSQNKGIVLSARNSSGSIQSQEAVYLVMALYESRTGTKIATIQIRNYGLTANMTGLSENYKQSVRAAFELGICSGSGFDPASNIKVKEILEILGSLDAKSKL